MGLKKKPPKSDVLDIDPVFQKLRADKAKELFRIVVPELEKIVAGKRTEEHVTSKGDVILTKPSNQDVCKAAEQLRKWTLDKEVADKKDLGRDRKGTPADDMAGAVREIARRKQYDREKKAEKEGKLVRMVLQEAEK